MSEWLEVTIHKDGKMYKQRYERGKVMYPLKVVGDTTKRGTEVVFLPDKEIFEETKLATGDWVQIKDLGFQIK